MPKSVLIVDDNIKLCKSLARNFNHLGYRANYNCCKSEVENELKNSTPDAVVLDVALGEESGLDILDYIKSQKPSLPVVMVTGFGTIEIAVESIKKGAFDFIQKPLEFKKLQVIVDNACKMGQLNHENLNLKNKVKALSSKIISENKRVLDILNKAEKLANQNFPILIQGESGTGKEGLAEYIHNHSDRSGMEIVKINCSAFPENLLDNELFGHEKGAYTGAVTKFRGVFEKADKGTLLLDEIGDMSLQTQAKILRTLQNSEIRPIGAEKNRIIDVRFIASTNKDLKELIKKNQFREDLYYRLSTATLYLPPLRDRKEDIPLLLDYFLEQFNRDNRNSALKYSNDFLVALMGNNWNGNIRELKNVVNYSAAIAQKGVIEVKDLPPSFLGIPEISSTFDLIKDSEKNLILNTLKKTNNNKKRTSEILKISRKTLYNKMDKYGIA